ncbi:hypothetical protein [Janthinobacterium sp. SUN206]|uniref:hypothetical protein n=1 Tax=Janthinobacterium sp. SUN206 TaxID=3014787 RepID=UPI002713595C|nr:hypothetical protein [Janthinobacterium sp. SUN206]MDO8065576.1 hypothetical protein [Janthinobacterium sp. SUN206]
MEFTTAVSVVRLGKASYDQRHIIQKYWTVLKAWFDKGETQILVTGHSGAGKSVLTGQLHGSARDLYYEAPSESQTVEVEAITIGEWTKLVRVLPGQKGRRTAGEIDSLQENESLDGVIHVVDFGYVAPRDPVVAQALVEEDGIVTLQELRERNLKLEVEDLKDLIASIRRLHHQHKRPKWLIIAVNKVDLYPTERSMALAHYHSKGTSPFSKALRELQQEIGENNLAIYVVEVCSHEADFIWNGFNVPSALAPREDNTILRNFSSVLSTVVAKHA